MNTAIIKKPMSWTIWTVLWVIGVIGVSLQISGGQANAIDGGIALVLTGAVVLSMLYRASWTMPITACVVAFDVIGALVLMGMDMSAAEWGEVAGSFVKETIFLMYLLMSSNAKAWRNQ